MPDYSASLVKYKTVCTRRNIFWSRFSIVYLFGKGRSPGSDFHFVKTSGCGSKLKEINIQTRSFNHFIVALIEVIF